MDVKVPHKYTRNFLRLHKACIVFFVVQLQVGVHYFICRGPFWKT
jgi:hypothetical protein